MKRVPAFKDKVQSNDQRNINVTCILYGYYLLPTFYFLQLQLRPVLYPFFRIFSLKERKIL